jgi:4-hydroxy-3-polyprenylbenzoate decarboxylase
MPFNDIRSYITALEKVGEVVRVEQEVDWDLEAGAIVRRACQLEAPAPFFQKMKDYPAGYRMFGAPMASFRRVALALDLDPDTHYSEIFEEYYRRSRDRITPVIVGSGPCQENVVMGEEVNLFQFPAPMIHDGDGGRYISSWHIIATRDPETGWTNWGMYRQMVHNRRLMGGLCTPNSDQGRIQAKYDKRGQNMPFATVIGGDPLALFTGTAVYPYGQSEADLAGALRREPVELVKCKTVDIYVPAQAEIVIEGEVLSNVRVEEGPFGEYTGYRSSPRMPRSVYQVNCITFRNDPILTMTNMGVPVDDSHICCSLSWAGEIRKLLEEQGFPITGVYMPPEAVLHMVVVGVEVPYAHIATQIANCIFGSKFGGVWMHEVVVVDSDVDIYNMKEVIHALATKCHPVDGILVQDKSPGHPLAPYLSLEDRTWFRGAKVVFDCTWPTHWPVETARPPKSAFNTIYPQEVQEKVLANWQKYGYK